MKTGMRTELNSQNMKYENFASRNRIRTAISRGMNLPLRLNMKRPASSKDNGTPAKMKSAARDGYPVLGVNGAGSPSKNRKRANREITDPRRGLTILKPLVSRMPKSHRTRQHT